MLDELDPSQIEDPALRQQFVALINLLEKALSDNTLLKEENLRLKDEIRCLKGGQGRPPFKPAKNQPSLSCEKERGDAAPGYTRPPKKDSKNARLTIDRTEILKVDRQSLPRDAQFKGHEEIIVQDVVFQTETILFRKEKFYSPSQRLTFTAQLPQGYAGQFGPGVKAWVLNLYFAGGMSEPKLLEFLHTVGLEVSAGQLSDWLIHDQQAFHAEKAEVIKAGIASSPWQHLDSTATTLFGQTQHCHILCNPLYTAYTTLPSKDRLSLVKVLLGGVAPLFRLDQSALVLLEEAGVAAKWRKKLAGLSYAQDWSEAQLDQLLAKHLPKLKPHPTKLIKDVLAITSYHSRPDYPVVQLLVCDDAPVFNGLSSELALCWLHEARHYKKLLPRTGYAKRRYSEFSTQLWNYYRELLAYRLAPSEAEASRLRDKFDRIFNVSSGYEQLDERKALTLAKKKELLAVLAHPEIALHNNPAELGARQRVRKRDVSLQACQAEGLAAWDTFQSLVETAKKLGVNIYRYFYDRVSGQHKMASLASLITQKAAGLNLGQSWLKAEIS